MKAASVGIIGVGRMGRAAAERLRSEHEVVGYDLRPFPEAGIAAASTPGEVAERCDVILLMLPSPRETRALFADAAFRQAFMTGTAVVVDMSTSDPASLRALAADLGAAASRLLDAPVLGRPDRCGHWTVPVGGDPETLERARPALAPLAARVERVGALGSGHTVKLLNNLMFAAINVVTAEVIAACDALGLPPERFVDIVANSQAATVSPLFRDLAPRMVAPRMVGPRQATVFTVELLAKDLQLAARMCEDAGATLVSTRASQIVAGAALGLGLAHDDTAALVDWYRHGVEPERG